MASERDNSIGFLETVRAASAVWVLTAHCVIWAGAALPAWFDPKIAVDVFMVLSGFLMMLVSKEEPARSFYLRRFFRLAPAYYVSLALAVVLSPQMSQGYQRLIDLGWNADIDVVELVDVTAANIALHMSFLFGLFPESSSNTLLPDWSLSLEMQFYAAFPLLVRLSRRFGPYQTIAGLALFSVCSILVYRAGVGTHWPPFREPSLLPMKLNSFLAGMALFWAVHAATWPGRTFGVALATGTAAVQSILYYEAVAVLPALVLIIGATLLVGGKMTSSPLRHLSKTSYSVYLFHGFFLALVGSEVASIARGLGASREATALLLWLVVAPATIGAATLTFSVVERPFIRLARWVGSRPRQESGINDIRIHR